MSNYYINYLETIRLDYPGNQLFYTINRIPKTEENFDPTSRSTFLSSEDDDQIQVLNNYNRELRGIRIKDFESDQSEFRFWSSIRMEPEQMLKPK